MIWGQVTAYFTKDCWGEGSAEQWRGIRRQETHSGAGAFPASAPHNCGNNTRLLTSGNDAHVNTYIPSPTTLCAAASRHYRPCLSLQMRPLWTGGERSNGECSVQCDIRADTSILLSRWSVAWTSGRKGINSVSVQVAEWRPSCGFFFLHKSTTKWTYTWFRKRKHANLHR